MKKESKYAVDYREMSAEERDYFQECMSRKNLLRGKMNDRFNG